LGRIFACWAVWVEMQKWPKKFVPQYLVNVVRYIRQKDVLAYFSLLYGVFLQTHLVALLDM
jgi:hypothetical protein